ncbi:MAG: hypothetical protein A3B14_01955 [Candidatus Zambryskibacteria bacterium RIFCSPLOWO2_01_FULL_45_21]|uniref:Uncharacterized protein n=1 Tax=Candidatus Zambryskibacteria bacterium RIFCSPLOWO2_01_FULL_45_21 TaxID=1802761 RepID=A0A1G2U467_9BACT|nr:MAG: hypothetical protein A3B14_01955 [Candidatus Zambryskibacteria bacterium RIFCSPLOWO2_01_FULL_45_21]
MYFFPNIQGPRDVVFGLAFSLEGGYIFPSVLIIKDDDVQEDVEFLMAIEPGDFREGDDIPLLEAVGFCLGPEYLSDVLGKYFRLDLDRSHTGTKMILRLQCGYHTRIEHATCQSLVWEHPTDEPL